MKCLPTHFDAAYARRRFSPRRFERCSAWWSQISGLWPGKVRQLAAVPRLELIYLPHYLVTFTLEQTAPARQAGVMVGAHEPTVTLWDLTHTEWQTTVSDVEFPPTITTRQAMDYAQRLVSSSLRRLAPAARSVPALDLATIETIAYPYWAFYYERWAGKYDVRLLDAVSGRPAGARIKVALLAALAARRDLAARTNQFSLETAQ